MKKIIISLVVSVFTLIGCQEKGWSEEDKNTFLKDCIAFTNGSEGEGKICKCGLEKIMKKYPNLREAEEAMQNMNEKEIMLLLEDCLD